MAITDIQNELKELLKIRASNPSILSVYLNTSGVGESAADKVQIFLKHALQVEKSRNSSSPEVIENLEKNHKRLLKFLESDLESQFRGVALFISASMNIFIPFKSMLTFKNEYKLGDQANLRQLLELSDEYKPTLLVYLDSRDAKILQIVLGSFANKEEFHSDTPPRAKYVSGLIQTKYQRHVEFHVKELAKEVAEEISRLIDEEGFQSVILAGQPRNLPFLKEKLPKRVLELVNHSITFEKTLPDQKAVEFALDEMQRSKRVEEKQVVENLITSAKSGGDYALVGLRKTINACNQGQIRRLLVSDSFSSTGFKCRGCQSLFDRFELQCPGCGKKLEEVELGYALMSRAKELNGDIEVIHENKTFDDAGAVGAYLRGPSRPPK
ncbi:host attachment protein [Bdellovibrionota bacterium]